LTDVADVPPCRLTWTAYGHEAYAALRAAMARIQQDDPLAPVTVVVPDNMTGTIVRRALARTPGPAGTPGVAALTLSTAQRLAELLAAPTLTTSGRRPATTPVVAAGWRAALADRPGLFASVAAHPATVTALVEADRLLSELDTDELAAVADSGRLAADVVRLHRAVAYRLGTDWYDTAALFDTSVSVLEAPGGPSPDPAMIVFLPQDLPSSGARLLRAIASRSTVEVIAGITGVSRADAGVLRTVRRVVGDSGLVAPTTVVPVAHHVVHASDSDDEVRTVLRLVGTALDSTRAHRIAVLYGKKEPYARQLHEQLQAAGLTVNGPGVRPTAEHLLPRAFIDLLGLLTDDRLSRASLFAALTGGPFRDAAGTLIPASRWERLTREAGVTDASTWVRVTRYASRLRRDLEVQEAAPVPSEGRIERLRRDADTADA